MCQSSFVEEDINAWGTDASNAGFADISNGIENAVWIESDGHEEMYNKLWSDTQLQRHFVCFDNSLGLLETTDDFPTGFTEYVEDTNCSDSTSLDSVQGVYATMTPTEQSQQTPAPTTSSVIPTTSTAMPTYQSGCSLQSGTFVSDAGISVSVVDLEADV